MVEVFFYLLYGVVEFLIWYVVVLVLFGCDDVVVEWLFDFYYVDVVRDVD